MTRENGNYARLTRCETDAGWWRQKLRRKRKWDARARVTERTDAGLILVVLRGLTAILIDGDLHRAMLSTEHNLIARFGRDTGNEGRWDEEEGNNKPERHREQCDG